MKSKKYDMETNSYKNIDIIGKVRYIGQSFGLEGLTDKKIYDVVKIEGNMIRVIDDSEEDYLYSIITPSALDDYKKCGKWEIIEDNANHDLKRAIEKYS